MAPLLQTLDDTTITRDDGHERTVTHLLPPLHPPFAASSLCKSPLPSTFFPSSSPSTLPTTTIPLNFKLPSQISTIFSLSLSSATPPNLFSFHSTPVSSNPLHLSTPSAPRRTSHPSEGGGALRRAAVVWFRCDLRVRDNECLNSANTDSSSVLPVYCFDPREYGKSSSGFDKTGPNRASFLIESVADLRESLRAKGSDLVVRIGRPETVLPELAKAVGADAVYAHMEVSHDEVRCEEKVEQVLKEEGVEVKYFWGSTLHHVEDLPYKVEDMPSNYTGFRDSVSGLRARKAVGSLEKMKRLPSRGDVDRGEMPSLTNLGVTTPSSPAASRNGKACVNEAMLGGETEAFQRIANFSAECAAQPPKGSTPNQTTIYGANFSCKISPWLSMGCISPRTVFEELNKTTSRSVSSAGKDNGGGSTWLMYELLWRDFFRFVTKKYSGVKQGGEAPVKACTGALV